MVLFFRLITHINTVQMKTVKDVIHHSKWVYTQHAYTSVTDIFVMD